MRSPPSVAVSGYIGHQIAMKSEEKDAAVGSKPVGMDARLERREREAAALRANLRRRKQQQKARQAKAPAEPDPEERDEP